MMMQGRQLSGWVQANNKAYGIDGVRTKLIAAAIEFNRTLPKKVGPKKIAPRKRG
jgi:hypothetical protein